MSGHSQARNRTIDWSAQQVIVVDIHSLHASAQLFVVGVLLKRMMDQKERQGGSRPLVFVVLDELNKYAPREGWSPLHSVLLDIAERGRSLGVWPFGAQQTASEVERRSSKRCAESRGPAGRRRGRTQRVMDSSRGLAVSEPRYFDLIDDCRPTRNPDGHPASVSFPSWATRKDEVSTSAAGPIRLLDEPQRCVSSTPDWHAGRH